MASGQPASTDGVGSEDSELAQGKRVSDRGVEHHRKPSRRTHLTLGELAGISGRSAKYLRALIRRGTLAAEKVAGRYYFRRRTLDETLKSLAKRMIVPPGFLSTRGLADHLGASRSKVRRAIEARTLAPDAKAACGTLLFRVDRLDELQQQWNDRHLALPDGEVERVVVTEFGMIRPRPYPDPRVMATFFWLKPIRRRPRQSAAKYNLADLFGEPAKTGGAPIFQGSVKSMRSKRG